jgi:hypothetical protein
VIRTKWLINFKGKGKAIPLQAWTGPEGCELLNKERDSLISSVLQADVWPISKETLIRKHFGIFVKFTNEISFYKLNEVFKSTMLSKLSKLHSMQKLM